MTPEERLNSILNKKGADKLSWTVLVDNNTLKFFPEELQGNYGIDFYRHIGCDILLLNGWNTPYTFKSPELKWGQEVQFQTYVEGDKVVNKWITKRGILTGITDKNGHPLKYPVDSLKAIKIYREMWENASFIYHDDSETYKNLKNLIGNSGVIARFWGPSTIPRLLEYDMGIENFYYLFNDYPDEMINLIETIHKVEKRAFKILAQHPCSCIILVENTSTFYITPEIYKKFNMPHQSEFVEEIKRSNKTAILHMCGHVKNILHFIKETKCDGIHALTPPPTGNTPWELALDILGEETIIIGAIPPSFFILNKIEEIPVAFDKLITPRLKKANFVLGVFADGISVELERFYAIVRWIEKNRNKNILRKD